MNTPKNLTVFLFEEYFQKKRDALEELKKRALKWIEYMFPNGLPAHMVGFLVAKKVEDEETYVGGIITNFVDPKRFTNFVEITVKEHPLQFDNFSLEEKKYYLKNCGIHLRDSDDAGIAVGDICTLCDFCKYFQENAFGECSLDKNCRKELKNRF